MTPTEEDTTKKRKRLPPSLRDIVYVALISAPSPGKSKNFQVLAISMSDFSIIRLNYSRKTRLSPGMVLDLRDFGEMTHYTIDDNIPPESLDNREISYIGRALVSAGEKHPIGLLKAQTMAEEGIVNLFGLLNMDDPERTRVFSEEVKRSSFEGQVTHRDVFGHFIKAFSGAKNPPDIRQQEALISMCGKNPEVIAELLDGYLESLQDD